MSEVENVKMNEEADLSMMRHEVFRIGAKMDALPQIYVTKAEHDPWRQHVDRKLETLDAARQSDKQWNNDEHGKLAEAVVESERRIIQQNSGMETRLVEKIDANFKLGVRRQDDGSTAQAQHKMSKKAIIATVAVSSIGWIIGIAEFVIQFMHH